MSARLREALKSAGIIVLLLLLLWLTAATWLYDVNSLPENVRPFVTRAAAFIGVNAAAPAETAMGSRAQTYGDAVFPIACAVTWENGRAAAYAENAPEAQHLFSRLGTLIGEAAGSAETLEKITDRVWRRMLSGTGVYFALSGAEPLSLFALGLGVSRASELDISALLLTPDDGAVRICIQSADGARTALSSASAAELEAVIDEFRADGHPDWRTDSLFSFERGLEGELLLTDLSPTVKCISASSPAVSDTAFGSLLAAFDINPLTNNRYTTADGARHAVDGLRSAELMADGTFVYSAEETDERSIRIDCSTDALAIENARRIAAATAGSFAGDGAVTLKSFSQNGGEVRVSFGYTVFGAPVYCGESDVAAVFSIRGGVLRRAEIRLRRYADAGDARVLMPESRAQTIAGGECMIGYVDSGDGVLAPEWIKVR